MVNPQLEDGYTRIANEILEAMARINLNGYQSRVLMVVWRKTYGWGKKADWIAQTQIAEMTGIRESHVSRTLKELKDRRIITKNSNRIAFNKNYSEWKGLHRKVTNSGNYGQRETEPFNQNDNESEVLDGKVTYPGNNENDARKVTNSGKKVTNSGKKKLPRLVTTKEKKETNKQQQAAALSDSSKREEEERMGFDPENKVDHVIKRLHQLGIKDANKIIESYSLEDIETQLRYFPYRNKTKIKDVTSFFITAVRDRWERPESYKSGVSDNNGSKCERCGKKMDSYEYQVSRGVCLDCKTQDAEKCPPPEGFFENIYKTSDSKV